MSEVSRERLKEVMDYVDLELAVLTGFLISRIRDPLLRAPGDPPNESSFKAFLDEWGGTYSLAVTDANLLRIFNRLPALQQQLQRVHCALADPTKANNNYCNCEWHCGMWPGKELKSPPYEEAYEEAQPSQETPAQETSVEVSFETAVMRRVLRPCQSNGCQDPACGCQDPACNSCYMDEPMLVMEREEIDV